AMGQGVLPVLLALRALRHRHLMHLYAWPGVLFQCGRKEIDVDLLASSNEDVWAVECKVDARQLDDEQLKDLLDLSERLHAKPAAAAVAGNFRPAVRERVLA